MPIVISPSPEPSSVEPELSFSVLPHAASPKIVTKDNKMSNSFFTLFTPYFFMDRLNVIDYINAQDQRSFYHPHVHEALGQAI